MSQDLLVVLARRIYNIELSRERGAELVVELDRLDAGTRAAADGLDFDTASWSHAAAVTAWLAGDD